MEKARLAVVQHARLPHAPDGCGPDDLVVVYTDEHAHAGEGKVLMTLERARERHPGFLCSRFVPPGRLSYRLLCIGRKHWRLRYTSEDNWQSNVGAEGEITAHALSSGNVTLPDGWPPVIWAVDFVQEHGELLAVDLNPAPGIQGTGLLTALGGFSIPGELLAYARLTGERFWERP